jgi:uncharacterized protein (DUF427 family)
MSDLATWSMRVPPPRVEPSPRWIRVRAGDVEVANSRRAMLLTWYGPGMLPTYCLPPDDVEEDLLVPSGSLDSDGFRVRHDVRIGDLVLERVAQRFTDPPAGLEELDGWWTFTWDAGLSWFEEALEVHVHAKDTSKRVDAVPSERHVRVELGGEVVADSSRPVAVFETTLPTRWYLPPGDVRPEILVASETVSRCPYKGTASYLSVRAGGTLHTDIAWTYPEPVPECPRIAGLIAFFNERVDLVIDGVRAERPRTPWST